MAGFRKTKGKLEELRGKAKERPETSFGDRSPRARGRAETTIANLGRVGEKINDTFKTLSRFNH